MNNNLFAELQFTHVKAWNENDPEERRKLLHTIYAEDIKMYDSQNVIVGLDAVVDFIGTLITKDPVYSFSPDGELEVLQNSARLYGNIHTSGGQLRSMDFFLTDNGKVQHLYVYLQPV